MPSQSNVPAWPTAPQAARPIQRGMASRSTAPGFAPAGAAASEKTTFQKKLVYVLWFIILFDPQFLLQSIGLAPAVRVPLALAILLAMSFVARLERGDMLWGIAAFIVATAANFPFAYNRGMSMVPFKALLLFYIVGIGVVRTMRTPKSAGPILFLLCVGQYLWWGVFGVKSGMVPWHPNLSNFDGYGPLMAVGVGPAYFYAAATTNRTHRMLALLAAALCVVGVVSAFARGSVLALIATVGYMWLRSPNKARMAGMMAAGLMIVAVAASVINGATRGEDTQSNFWTEMGTMFDQSEGSTGDDRKNLWHAATIVFINHPIMGVGAENFGAAAATMIQAGEVGGEMSRYSENPAVLYGRALHSNYYQILSEYGLIGVTIFICILVQFWRRSRALMGPECEARWRAAGGTLELKKIALGIEAGVVSFLVSGVFFNQIFQSWFYSLLIAQAMLFSIATGSFNPRGLRFNKPVGRRAPAR